MVCLWLCTCQLRVASVLLGEWMTPSTATSTYFSPFHEPLSSVSLNIFSLLHALSCGLHYKMALKLLEEAAAWFISEVTSQATKDKGASCKIKYVCLFGVLRIAIQRHRFQGTQKCALEKQRRLEFLKRKEGIYVSCFEQNVIGADIAIVTLSIYMWLVVRTNAEHKVHFCQFQLLPDALAFRWVQSQFWEFEAGEKVHKSHLLYYIFCFSIIIS